MKKNQTYSQHPPYYQEKTLDGLTSFLHPFLASIYFNEKHNYFSDNYGDKIKNEQNYFIQFDIFSINNGKPYLKKKKKNHDKMNEEATVITQQRGVNLRKILSQEQLIEHYTKKCQGVFRSQQVRRKFLIHPLPNPTESPVFIFGNDPEIVNLTWMGKGNKKIGVIGTSGLRSILIAANIAQNNTHLPKVIIIDNAKPVIAFWRTLKAFMRNDTLAKTSDIFFQNILILQINLLADALDTQFAFNGDRVKFKEEFTRIFDAFDYMYIRKIILYTSVFLQDWGDRGTFFKLKNLIDYLEIKKLIVYPSNIVACTADEKRQLTILDNIQIVDPLLAIHTNLKNGRPKHVFFFHKHQKLSIEDKRCQLMESL